MPVLPVKWDGTKERTLPSGPLPRVVTVLLFCPLEHEPEEELVTSHPAGTSGLRTLTDRGSHAWR